MENLLQKSAFLIERVSTHFHRSLFTHINWKSRLIGIKGARGTGKTTLILQQLRALDLLPTEAAYFSLDDVWFLDHSLVDVATDFSKKGGKYLFLDEVHKYPHWSRHIKNLYDFIPDLKIVFTGSSIIDISREEVDLCRRAIMYELSGMSFREYLGLRGILNVPAMQLEEVLRDDKEWRKKFPLDFKPLQHFQAYLEQGYYPFAEEDNLGFRQRLQQMVRIIVEYDMAESHDFDVRNAKKMLHLLYILSVNVPFKPNLKSIAEKVGIHRNTISNYIHYLEQARLIKRLFPSGNSVSALQKPEKIYLDNTNLAFALADDKPDKGNLRETFIFNQLNVKHKVTLPPKGDFMIDEKWVIEVGGKNKTAKQLKNIENGFRVLDDIDFPVAKEILPLWLFGFLY